MFVILFYFGFKSTITKLYFKPFLSINLFVLLEGNRNDKSVVEILMMLMMMISCLR